MYADRPKPPQRASPNRGELVLVFRKLVECVWLMVYFFLEILAEGWTQAADWPAFLEALVVSFKVLDVTS